MKNNNFKTLSGVGNIANSYCEGNWLSFVSIYPTNFHNEFLLFYYSSLFMFEPDISTILIEYERKKNLGIESERNYLIDFWYRLI